MVNKSILEIAQRLDDLAVELDCNELSELSDALAVHHRDTYKDDEAQRNDRVVRTLMRVLVENGFYVRTEDMSRYDAMAQYAARIQSSNPTAIFSGTNVV